jgi:alpha-D-ribose 1-methylphosphonate 5-triphosphate synthase subunit PhnH
LFALVIEPLALPPLSAFNIGTDEFPDRSATLILEVAALQEGFGARLSGPGIRDRHLRVGGLPEQFWTERVELQELFPRGLDVVLTCGDRLAALPRTTRREDL